MPKGKGLYSPPPYVAVGLDFHQKIVIKPPQPPPIPDPIPDSPFAPQQFPPDIPVPSPDPLFSSPNPPLITSKSIIPSHSHRSMDTFTIPHPSTAPPVHQRMSYHTPGLPPERPPSPLLVCPSTCLGVGSGHHALPYIAPRKYPWFGTQVEMCRHDDTDQ